MKVLARTATVALACLASVSWADVDIKLPEGVSVVAKNGEDASVQDSISLPNGLNQIVVTYMASVGRKRNDDEVEYSDAFVVKFSANDKQLRLVVPKVNLAHEMEAFNRSGNIRLGVLPRFHGRF